MTELPPPPKSIAIFFSCVRVHVATGEEPTYTVSQAEAGRLLLKYVTRHPSTRHGDAAASDADELGGA